MAWSVKAFKDEHGKARVSVSYSEYDADMNHMLPSEAERFANQLLIAAAEAKKLLQTVKAFYR